MMHISKGWSQELNSKLYILKGGTFSLVKLETLYNKWSTRYINCAVYILNGLFHKLDCELFFH